MINSRLLEMSALMMRKKILNTLLHKKLTNGLEGL